MSEREAWSTTWGDGPLVATAIHAGHDLRPEVLAHRALADADQLREEDPYTDGWLSFGPNRVAVHVSRFEVDLNRPPEKAVYRVPDDAWGLPVWRGPLPEALVAKSMRLYERFYAMMEERLAAIVARHGRVVVFDLHSYNHRRGGPGATPDDPARNPSINLGTESIDTARWGEVVAAVGETLRAAPVGDGRLDVGENVKFRGGHFPRWVNARFGGKACAVAIEMKKVFMDEWTGALDRPIHGDIGAALAAAADRALEAMGNT